MKNTLFFFLFSSSFAYTQNINFKNCSPENSQSEYVYSDDFKWGYSLSEMVQKSQEIYASRKRLAKRAYWDSTQKSLILPYSAFNGGPVKLAPQFAKNVAGHIEAAFQKNVVDVVIFPDMGHSHFFIPEDRYKSIYDLIPVKEFSRLYEELFKDPTLQVLYHTAEQLKMLDENHQLLPDKRIRFRHKTRNLVGSNDGRNSLQFLSNPQSAPNTASELAGYHYWGAGFNLSANKSGCFSATVNGKSLNFDISLYDLEPRPTNSVTTDM